MQLKPKENQYCEKVLKGSLNPFLSERELLVIGGPRCSTEFFGSIAVVWTQSITNRFPKTSKPFWCFERTEWVWKLFTTGSLLPACCDQLTIVKSNDITSFCNVKKFLRYTKSLLAMHIHFSLTNNLYTRTFTSTRKDIPVYVNFYWPLLLHNLSGFEKKLILEILSIRICFFAFMTIFSIPSFLSQHYCKIFKHAAKGTRIHTGCWK